MIFLRYESFKGYLRNYPVTAAIASLCIVYYFITAVMGNPGMGSDAYRFGAFYTIADVDPWGLTEPWRYITSIFMHADFGHLFRNMMMLIIFAPPLEYVMKSKRYVWFYLFCGIGGNALSALISNINGDSHLSVGASGAIFGVFGAYFFLAMFRKRLLDAASIQTIYIILGISLITTFVMPAIDVWGHIGGFATGFMLYRFFDQLQLMKLQKKR
ncbi:rhomboid family intramembrane serine protease [Paenibacillus septentrionalis]|uniref:Rhomboid family intramembrane serine protease n=1 Tax=Paenibacillus septentrionalis TaxID=429342 RepID=A0ABW1V190_9BACL